MKIVLIGATGTIGRPVADLLSRNGNEVIRLSRNTTPGVNIDDPASIEVFYRSIGQVDAVICTAGDVSFGPLATVTDEQIQYGIRSKLLGQVNLVRKGISNLRPGGVFVLTGGMLAYAPWPNTATVAMLNTALEGFVRAAALEMQDGRRVTIVHPPLIRETAVQMGRDGTPWPEAAAMAATYKKALEGDFNGKPVFLDGYGPSQ